MELREYLEILRKRGWIILVTAVLCAVAGFLFSGLQEPMYRASIQVRVEPARIDWGNVNAVKTLLRSYQVLIYSHQIAQKVIERAQLDMTTDVPLVTPAGKKTSTRQWAQVLNLDYAPTLIFFDEWGREIVRIDSVIWFYRLQNVLTYINSKAYRKQPNFQNWRQQQRR